MLSKNAEINDYINNRFGYFDYFDTRSYVKSASNNTLKEDYPNSPYTAKEVLEWALWNDENSYFMTAGKQAIEGQKTLHDIIGTPKINPLTEKPNSLEDQGGLVGKATSNITTSLLYIGGSLLLFTYLKSVANKKGGL